jgi:hypothetical protein
MKMLTQQEIEQAYQKMNLFTEDDRRRFIKLAELGTKSNATKELIFIECTTTTSPRQEDKYGELATDPE